MSHSIFHNTKFTDTLGFWLRTEKLVDEVTIDIEVTRVGTHISHKIIELLRKDKKYESDLNDCAQPAGDHFLVLLVQNIYIEG